MSELSNKALEQTSGALTRTEAPFAAQRQCSTDLGDNARETWSHVTKTGSLWQRTIE